MKLATILMGAYLTAMPMNHPNLLNKLGQFPMANVEALQLVYEDEVTCKNMREYDIIIRKYAMRNQVIAMTATRKGHSKYFAIRLVNGKIYVDNGEKGGIVEDGFIDNTYDKKRVPPMCMLIPKNEEI